MSPRTLFHVVQVLLLLIYYTKVEFSQFNFTPTYIMLDNSHFSKS